MESTKTKKSSDQNVKQDRYAIQSIEKSLDVIEILSMHDSLSLIELAELVNQPKSSLYRIILTLEKRGFISRSDADGKYCLGYKQLIITKNLLERITLRSSALTEMNKLVEKYGDTVNLCVLSDDVVLYVAIIEGTHALRMTDTIGSTQPFHATATGKAMAAFQPEEKIIRMIKNRGLKAFTANTITDETGLLNELSQVKKQGYAVDNEEITQGARCVAAPIFNMYGHVEGAISLSGSLHRFPDANLEDIAADILEAGQQISYKMGFPQNRDEVMQ